ncbi:MAG: hypothetical protein H7222_13685, partial [Methylotenera sp.]|nr:hypothetical protein [Oligoflexia bacterium]
MSVKQYEKDGKTFWLVYIDLRSRKKCRLRVQKRITCIKTEAEALALEKKYLRDMAERLSLLEAKGSLWEEVIERWVRQQELYPTRRLAKTTIQDYE